MFNNIPEELGRCPNWILWKHETVNGRATKVPYDPNTGKHASVSNPKTWGTFEQCRQILPVSGMSGIGFVITPECGLTCIDIDDPYKLNPDGTPKFNNPEELQQRQIEVSNAFNTYQEISPSGKGLHIWVKGSVPSGRDKFSIGLYPSARYMTMTGQVYKQAPIAECQDPLHQLWADLGSEDKGSGSVELVEPNIVNDTEQEKTDNEILEIAMGAVNGEKFTDLWQGEWNRHYPSQSEADIALINILAYYTKNRVQITRMFRNSGLGQRKKALRADYCEKMINRAFDQEPEPIDVSALRDNLAKQFAEKIKPPEPKPLPVSEVARELHVISPEIYQAPRGLIEELTAFIYASAPRPVPEIALAAAIGLMSGVCGRCYNISGTGLNQYTVLLAMTGRGKDAMANGISKLVASVLPTVPQATIFSGPSKIASQEALLKHISKTSKSFLSIMGEFADTLKRMSNDSRNAAQQGVKQAMLDLYNKSGKGCILGNMIYSDAAKNTDSVTAPAFSLLGEATPEKFYELMTDGMISEGFLPRFTIIEYLGNRPELKKNHENVEVPRTLKEAFSQLCAYSLQLNSSDNVVKIDTSDEAQEFLDEFNRTCDNYINNGNSASQELWNRAHIKVLKLAGLLAVGSNYIRPCVSLEHAQWASRLIVTNIQNILKRFDSGDVGVQQNQNTQLSDLKKAFSWYFQKPWSEIEKYPGATVNSYNAKIVPHSFITAVCRSRASFKADRQGPVQALRTLLISLLESGEIQEVSVMDKVKLGIGKNGKAYAVIDPKAFFG